MKFLNNWKHKKPAVVKALQFMVLGAIGIFAVMSVLSVVPSAYPGISLREQVGFGGGVAPSAPTAPDYAYSKGYATDGSAEGIPGLSLRNVMPAPTPGGTTGADAEEFEVTDYNAHIETRNLEETCEDIAGLKGLDALIFENSSKTDRSCNYTFKVEKAFVEDVLAFIEEFDPRDLSENTYTIKRQIEDFTSEEEILKSKLSAIDATLRSATAAYDEVTRLATRTQDAEALAKIIDSKINVIERLTQEKIRVSEQLDRLARAKADQLDRLDYTYFNVYVSESTFIDGEYLKDSWKAAIRDFVRTVNQIVQSLSIGIIAFVLFALQAAVYIFLALVAIKYGIRFGKELFKR